MSNAVTISKQNIEEKNKKQQKKQTQKMKKT